MEENSTYHVTPLSMKHKVQIISTSFSSPILSTTIVNNDLEENLKLVNSITDRLGCSDDIEDDFFTTKSDKLITTNTSSYHDFLLSKN
jgi:hypothetical protein